MIKVGCCGYPISMKKYFNEFNLVEIQSTFYKLPQVSTAKRWREEAPQTFEFIVKAWQAITHPWGSPTWRKYGKTPPGKLENYGLLKYTGENKNAWRMTVEVCNSLGCDKVLIQLPPKLKLTDENMDEIMSFIDFMVGDGLQLIIEPRDKTWNNPKIINFFGKLDIIHCVDPFKDKPWGTGKFYYFRLHGINGYNYRYKYSDSDLIDLKEMILKLPRKEIIYVLFNNKYMYEDSKKFISFISNI